MAPAAQRDRVDASLSYNPRFVLQKPTAVLSVFQIMVGIIFFTYLLES